MNRFTVMLSFLLVLFLASPVFSANTGLAIIVNKGNSNQLEEADIRRIYLGKSRAFPDGSDAVPIDQEAGTLVRGEFVRKVLKKNEGNLNAYWARMLFSSKAVPPKMIRNPEEIKKMVAEDKNKIGYIDAAQVDDTVRVLMIIP